MNPHAAQPIRLSALLRSIQVNRSLIFNLIKRDVISRYRGSVMGLLWSFLNPVFMLVVYTYVFSVVFKARWLGGSDSKVEFALVLFTGLLVYNLFSEVLNRAPTLILSNVNYVKKVIFPLEVVPIVAFGVAAFHMLVSLVVWLLFYTFFFGLPSWTLIQLPVVMVPLILITLGLAWILASLGVYLRDVGQIIGVITMALMFLSPIFYPVAALPEQYHAFMYMNPLTYIVEETRNVMIWKKLIDWNTWIHWTVVSVVVAWLGFAWFQKTRKGFADVL